MKLFHRLVKMVLLTSACLLLAGCAGAPVQKLNVSVSPDSLCRVPLDRSWSVNDTGPTIDEARRQNGAIDKACHKKAPTS